MKIIPKPSPEVYSWKDTNGSVLLVNYSSMKHTFFLILMGLLLASTVSAQKLQWAEDYFKDNRYKDALPIYEQLYAKTKVKATKAIYAFKIAECNRLLNHSTVALAWYDSTYLYGGTDRFLSLRTGECLLREGRYPEAEKYLKEYLEAHPGDAYAQSRLESAQYAQTRSALNPFFTLEPVSLNTAGYEYGLGIYGTNLIYAYGPPINESKGDVSARADAGNSALYVVSKGENGEWTKKLMPGLHEKGNSECCATYDPVMEVLYYTTSEPGTPLKIVAKEYNIAKDKWVKPSAEKQAKIFTLPKNVIGAHPFITPDEKRMYFSAIMDGGFGGADIWYVDRRDDGSWGQPVNAGANVNTFGAEIFPTVAENILYFSSNGRVGYGGYDIYASRIAGDVFSEAKNLGSPYNSDRDDMDLLVNSPLGKTLLVSDRAGNTFDDIYALAPEHPYNIEVQGVVRDSKTNIAIENAKVNITIPGEKDYSLQTGLNGIFIFNIVPGKETGLVAVKNGYKSSALHALPAIYDRFGSFDMTNPADNPNAVLYLAPIVPEDTLPRKIDEVELFHVYYGFNKSIICPESTAALDKIIAYMKTHDHTRVELAAHTDSRGSDLYNQDLSERRAESVVNYLLSKGVDAQRITYKGYGESRLYIPSARTEEEHWLNRRTEFIVVNGNDKIEVKSHAMGEEEYYNFCGGKGGMRGGMLSENDRDPATGSYIIQVGALKVGHSFDATTKKKVEQITGKTLQMYKASDDVLKYYVGTYTYKDAKAMAKKLKAKNVAIFIRREY